MNVFVLNTGRCGSTTFTKACSHITNFTSAHESRSMLTGRARLDFPPNHIEADNRLSWVLGRLDQRFGDSAFYVHLKRNDADTARSFARRYDSGIIRAYRDGILIGLDRHTDPELVARDYCDTVNSNIEFFLKDKTNRMSVNLENAVDDFRQFWTRIGAEGDLESALRELQVSYNPSRASKPRGNGQFFSRVAGKVGRLLRKLPRFVREA